ncbi:hypothetical protein GC169_09560 [bacterium]|nr:hypothetical protein [bacterium]
MQQHPIFGSVPPHVGSRAENELIDYAGARFRSIWDNQPNVPAVVGPWTLSPPDFNEEYFEWVDLLEAVRASRDTFVMAELGAGYGRWGVRGGAAARKMGLRPKLIFVEGEPKHVSWLNEAIKLNGLDDSSTVIEAAIAYGGKRLPFLVGHETLSIGFGQCLGWEGEGESSGETYFGRPVSTTPGGYRQIMVDPITLEACLSGVDVLDLIDMDLQKAELDLVRHSMDTLNAKARRVHIGTHGPDIEDELRATFSRHGWRKVWDFGCNKVNATPFGDISFVDGVQSWINPRLA